MGKCSDLDDLFAYKTAKIVVVKDRWLGLLNFGFTVSILAYIVGYEILWNRGYMEKDTNVQGIVEMSIRAPKDSYYTLDKFPYCK